MQITLFRSLIIKTYKKFWQNPISMSVVYWIGYICLVTPQNEGRTNCVKMFLRKKHFHELRLWFLWFWLLAMPRVYINPSLFFCLFYKSFIIPNLISSFINKTFWAQRELEQRTQGPDIFSVACRKNLYCKLNIYSKVVKLRTL